MGRVSERRAHSLIKTLFLFRWPSHRACKFAASAILDTFARFIRAFRWQDFSVSNILFHLNVAYSPAEAAVAAGKGQHAHFDR